MAKRKSTGRAGARRGALRLHGSIARDLGIAIVSGRLKSGIILDGEIEASEKLKVSRSAYREAIRILCAKGLVESRPKVGTRISARDSWHLLDPDVLSWVFAGSPDETLLKALFELRQMVEPAAAAMAATRRGEKHLHQMDIAVNTMTLHGLHSEAGQRADRDFHAALLHAADNCFVASLTRGIVTAVEATTIFKQRKSPLSRDPVPDHAKVYEAIGAGDPRRAQEAMTDLIRLAYLDTPGRKR
ncbi:MAG TPA: FadR/GntR family transcriptional regulator [Rhizomicrobium sp.]